MPVRRDGEPQKSNRRRKLRHERVQELAINYEYQPFFVEAGLKSLLQQQYVTFYCKLEEDRAGKSSTFSRGPAGKNSTFSRKWLRLLVPTHIRVYIPANTWYLVGQSGTKPKNRKPSPPPPLLVPLSSPWPPLAASATIYL